MSKNKKKNNFTEYRKDDQVICTYHNWDATRGRVHCHEVEATILYLHGWIVTTCGGCEFNPWYVVLLPNGLEDKVAEHNIRLR